MLGRVTLAFGTFCSASLWGEEFRVCLRFESGVTAGVLAGVCGVEVVGVRGVTGLTLDGVGVVDGVRVGWLSLRLGGVITGVVRAGEFRGVTVAEFWDGTEGVDWPGTTRVSVREEADGARLIVELVGRREPGA